MEWIGEQYAVREDQLARLLGRSERTARRWSRAMCEAGYCRRKRLVAGDPGWVWLTRCGTRLTEQGYSPWRANLGSLRHIAAVGELRLYLARRVPDAAWICERELHRERPNRAVHVPDALLEVDSERHALEVELTSKARKRLVSLVEELREGDGWPHVHVRDLTHIRTDASGRT